MDSCMSDVKKKAETKLKKRRTLLNTHAVECNELLILCVFAKKKIARSLYYNQQKVLLVQKGKRNCRSFEMKKKTRKKSCISHPFPWQQVDFWSWNNEWIKKAVSDGKREEQPKAPFTQATQSDTIPFISMESWRFPATRATAGNSDRWRPDGACHATRTLRVRVWIFGPVKTSTCHFIHFCWSNCCPIWYNCSIYTWPHLCKTNIWSSISALYTNLTEFTSPKATDMNCILFIIISRSNPAGTWPTFNVEIWLK